jgi:hypothetical protein
MVLIAVKHFKRDNAYDYCTRQYAVALTLAESGGILPRPVIQGAFRVIALVGNLYFNVYPLAVYRHIDVKPAEFVAYYIRRHFGIAYLKFLNILKLYAKYLRHEPFQQLRVLNEHHFEQSVVFERIFKFSHRHTPSRIYRTIRGQKRQRDYRGCLREATRGTGVDAAHAGRAHDRAYGYGVTTWFCAPPTLRNIGSCVVVFHVRR